MLQNYKIYAKAFQLRLQPVLMEVISLDQSTFLPLRFTLDNILLTQEMMSWTDQSHQSFLFLKLDFSKAYDMVEWDFLFGSLTTMGFLGEFNRMVQLLFQEASACMKVNGALSESFNIEREIRQGCPPAPYLFLVVIEVLNNMVIHEAKAKRVRGISLPINDR